MEGISTAITTSATSVAAELTGLVGTIAPIVLGVVGAVVLVKKGIGLFKSLTSKA